MATNIIPFPRRPDNVSDDDRAFNRAYHAAMIAKAERDLIEARWRADHYLSPLGHYSPLWDEREPAFRKMRDTAVALAGVPATTRADLARKKRAIGNVWIKAEGELYDFFRLKLAEDEARLAA